MTILHDNIHVAKKRHRCDQCHRHIEVGERYRKQVHTDDGFQTYRAHEDCDAVATQIWKTAKLNYDEYICIADDIDCGDRLWITAEYPAVACRLWPTTNHSN